MSEPLQRVRVLHDPDCASPRDGENLTLMFEVDWGSERSDNWMALVTHLWALPSYMVLDTLQTAMGVVGHECTEGHIDLMPGDRDALLILLEKLPEVKFAECHSERRRYTYFLVTQPMWLREGIEEDHVDSVIASEVETYEQWCEGNTYGFIIEQRVTPDGIEECDDEGELWMEVDACWGFIGDDFKTNGMGDYVPAELREHLLNAEIEYERY